ncbi:MAG: patatin-like phospholipase family protein [bacterium]|nr:patatin-like phospholipase family protein [bacterium]
MEKLDTKTAVRLAEEFCAGRSRWLGPDSSAASLDAEIVEIRQVIELLQADEQRALARRFLQRLIDVLEARADLAALRDHCRLQLALAYYKDDSLHPSQRLGDAKDALAGISLEGSNNQKLLCAVAAVHKYLWMHGGREEDLRCALDLYRTAHEHNRTTTARFFAADKDITSDENPGYPGINAAFLLDRLAERLARSARLSGELPEEAVAATAKARTLRQEVVAVLEEALELRPNQREDPWFVMTYAEALFGQGEHEAAGAWLERLGGLAGVDDWMRRTCFRQLAAIGLAQSGGEAAQLPEAVCRVLLPLLARDPSPAGADDLQKVRELAASIARGKVGLALSGGGHRAALYHLGVLARLADVGALRDVEAISTVSGGSIVGALYYLKLKARLEQHPDDELGDGAYKELVAEVIEDYVEGVQENVRMQSLASWKMNLLMMLRQKTHSQVLGELYERFFFKRALAMSDLVIRAQTASGEDFNPWKHNWSRVAKAPVILLNATTLNTGHNWQFTAKWMGEPPELRGNEIDKNERLRRAYYPEFERAAEPGFAARSLGEAVAASACVPGLFPPIQIPEMYEDRRVELVDGGCHDNQGIEALWTAGCERVLCSDASGQLHDEPVPSLSRFGVFSRMVNILMDRVRESQFRDFDMRVQRDAMKGLMFVHLKQGLPAHDVPWIPSNRAAGSASAAADDAPASDGPTDTGYGVRTDIQESIAQLRTDLDSFTDVEADALMCSGYLATRQQLHDLTRLHQQQDNPGTWGGYDTAAGGTWPFLRLRGALAGEGAQVGELKRQLEIGASVLFKPWKISRILAGMKWLLIALAAAGLVALAVVYWSAEFTLGVRAIIAFVAASLGYALLSRVMGAQLTHVVSVARDWVKALSITVVGAVVSKLHIRVFDKWVFQRLGRRTGHLQELYASSDTMEGPGNAPPETRP